MSTEQANAAELYKEYSPKVQSNSSVFKLWKEIENCFEFRDKPEEIQFLQLLKRYNDTILSMPEAPTKRVEAEFVQKEIGREGFKILCDDFLNSIEEGDIVEVYTLENIQLFRNFEYFKHSSYTLTELVSRPWTELFLRDESIIPALHKEVLEFLKLDETQMRRVQVPPHKLRESGGQGFSFEVLFKLGCPVVDKFGNKTAFAVSQTARRITSTPSNTLH